MDYSIMSSQDFKRELMKRREEIYSKTEKVGSMRAEKILLDEYENLCSDAAGGDPVAEDLLAEWFRNGNQVVPENMELSNKWLFFAGSNGNKFSLDRLKLHFAYVFDEIINLDDFGEIAHKHNITEYNYQYILGKLICDGVIDDLHLDALELAKQKPTRLPFSSVLMRSFDRSIERAVGKVIEYLRK